MGWCSIGWAWRGAVSKGSVNKVLLVGNLGGDPDVRYLAGGTAVVRLSVATTEAWKDHDGGKQERTEWHRVSLFGKLGEIAGQYLRQGSKVFLEGRLETTRYTREGVERYSTAVIAYRLEMLDGARAGEHPSPAPRTDPRPAAAPAAQTVPVPFDDDIPF
jgi:single-strand DNA-binding protein